MRYIILLFALSIMSCHLNETGNSKANATAQTVNGVYIFIKCKPTSNYDFLGSIQLNWYDKLMQTDKTNLESVVHNITSLVSFSDNLENTLNQVKQKYPTADGIIFDDDMSKCEAIKFK